MSRHIVVLFTRIVNDIVLRCVKEKRRRSHIFHVSYDWELFRSIAMTSDNPGLIQGLHLYFTLLMKLKVTSLVIAIFQFKRLRRKRRRIGISAGNIIVKFIVIFIFIVLRNELWSVTITIVIVLNRIYIGLNRIKYWFSTRRFKFLLF